MVGGGSRLRLEGGGVRPTRDSQREKRLQRFNKNF